MLRSSLAAIPSSSGSEFADHDADSDSRPAVPPLQRRGSAERLLLARPAESSQPEAQKEDSSQFLKKASRHLFLAAESRTYKELISFVTSNADADATATFLNNVQTTAETRLQGFRAFASLLETLQTHPSLDDALWYLASALHRYPVSDAKVPQGWNGGTVGPHFLAGLEMIGTKRREELRNAVYGLYRALTNLFRPGRLIGNWTRLLAMKSWTVKWLPEDHSFLHDIKVFPFARTIMSVPKQKLDLTALADYNIERPNEITTQGVLSASSSGGMLPSLIDDSTETFWESSDSNSGSPKYIDWTAPSETYVREVSVHIDNVRDREQAVAKLGIFFGSSADSLPEKPSFQVTIQPKSTQCWFTLPVRSKARVVRVVFTPKGGNARCRLFRAFGASPPNLMNELVEAKKQDERTPEVLLTSTDSKVSEEALLLFRLLTSQVFGGLMSPDQTEKPGVSLQEHLVGLLFIDEKRGLSQVQQEVFQNLFGEIQRESDKLRLGPEAVPSISLRGSTVFGSAAAEEQSRAAEAKKDAASQPDEYCFELVSIVLALSVSEKGQKFISSHDSISTLLSLLHTSTPRIQRQVTSILRRVLPHLNPSDLHGCFGQCSSVVQDGGVVFFLFLCVAKALQVQLRGRAGGQITIDTTLDLANEHLVAGPWLPGSVPAEIAPSLVSLILDLATHAAWAPAIDNFMTNTLFLLKDVQARGVATCSELPSLWTSLATLTVVGNSSARAAQLTESTMKLYTESGSFVPSLITADSEHKVCDNHDDGTTLASIYCSSCKLNLCPSCDRVLHLNRRFQDHFRNSMGVTEKSFAVDVHEGCSRAKMSSLLIVVDSERCKAVVNFRQEPTATSCRFCGSKCPTERKTPYIPDSPSLALVCEDDLCLDRAKLTCTRTHPCGHPCGGVRGEKQCLPCLRHCSTALEGPPLTQDHEDLCVICWCDPLDAAPTIRLKCGHCFHFECTQRQLQARWPEARITFNFLNCPLCKVNQIAHPSLESELLPLLELYEDVRRKALLRIEYMNMANSEDVTVEGGAWYGNLQGYALDRLCYYPCFKCKKPYFGGLRECIRQAASSSSFDPSELVCGGCSATAGGVEICQKHGRDYLEYKCRFCCSIACWFCFGTTHFCDSCHNDHSRLCSMRKEDFPQCPVGPRAEKLDGDECPLKIAHPPTGEEFALGCGICRNATTF